MSHKLINKNAWVITEGIGKIPHFEIGKFKIEWLKLGAFSI